MNLRLPAFVAILTVVATSPSLCLASADPLPVSAEAVHDGKANQLATAPFWKSTPEVTDFVNIQGGTPATARTACRFAHSPKALLVQCTAFQAPGTAHADADPANIQKGDNLAFGLTLNNDPVHPVQYVFFANPKGAKWATGTLDPVLKTPWDAVVSRTPTTWTVTYVVPFSSLKKLPLTEQMIRVGFVRNDNGNGTAWIWPNIPGKNPMSADGQARLNGVVLP